METTKSQEVIKKAGILIRLSLAEKIIDEVGKPRGTRSTGQHKVKFIEDKVINGRDFQTGKERLEMKYIFEEDNEKKFYTRPLRDDKGEVHYFIQRMSEYNYGDDLILEYIPKGLMGYIDIRSANKAEERLEPKLSSEVSDAEIPLIESEESEIKTEDIPF